MKTPVDVVLVVSIAAAFLCLCAGYALLIMQALRSANRQEAFRRIFDWRGHQHEMDPWGLRLIFVGALIGFLWFLGIGFLIRL